MAIHKRTDLKIKAKIREIQDAAFSPAAKNALLGDGEGLYLSITKTGTTSWLFRYMDSGKAKTIGLGGYPATTLSRARGKAQAMRDARSEGVDPRAFRDASATELQQSVAKARTFATCAEEYIGTQQESWKNEKHQQQWRNTLDQYAYQKRAGVKPFVQITRDLKPYTGQ